MFQKYWIKGDLKMLFCIRVQVWKESYQQGDGIRSYFFQGLDLHLWELVKKSIEGCCLCAWSEGQPVALQTWNIGKRAGHEIAQ